MFLRFASGGLYEYCGDQCAWVIYSLRFIAGLVSLQASTLILYFGLKSDNRSKIIWNVIWTNTCLKKINHLLSREKKEKNSHWLILKVFQWSKTTRHHKAILRHNVQWFTRLRFHIKGHNTRLITEPTVLVGEEMVNLSINA